MSTMRSRSTKGDAGGEAVRPRTRRGSARGLMLCAGLYLSAFSPIIGLPGPVNAQPVPALLQNQPQVQPPAAAPAENAQSPVVQSPVFVNESPAAEEGLARLRDLTRINGTDQAASLAVRLLSEEGDALVASPEGDGSLYIPLRRVVHELLRADAKLLERFVAVRSGPAESLLQNGEAAEVERSAFLTSAGLEASLRLAEEDLQSARFATCLRRLEALRDHPRQTEQTKTTARQIAAALTSYVPKGTPMGVRAAALAGDAAQVASPRVPLLPEGESPLSPALLRAADPARSSAATSGVASLVARPLWSAEFAPDEPLIPRTLPRGVSRVESLPRHARDLRVLPVKAGRVILVQRDFELSALDADTLQTLWKLDAGTSRPFGGPMRGQSVPDAEDISMPAVAGNLVIAALSGDLASDSNEQRLVACDVNTGQVRWVLSPDQIAPSIGNTTLRGPILIEGDTAIIALRKHSGERRLTALYLAGIHTATGKTRWTALVGSTGMLPWPPIVQVVDGAIVEEGVVYRSDRLGVVGAYEAGTGRALWVRRMPTDIVSSRQSGRAGAWQQHAPVKIGPWLFVLSPDRASVVKLDTTTGSQIAAVSEEAVLSPSYLLAAGEYLACVGEQQIVFVKAAEFGPQAQPVASGTVPPPGIRGRVVSVGPRLVVPVENGVGVISPEDPSKFIVAATLDHPGNALPTEDGLVVVDDARAHVYRDWDRAEASLLKRAGEDPSDASASIALIELAARTNRLDRAVAAGLSAIEALSKNAEKAPAQRERLASVLISVIDQDQATPQARAETRRAVSEMLDQLAQVASNPTQIATHKLLLSRQFERTGEPGRALNIAQGVLDALPSADVLFSTPRASAQADEEASRRLEQLIIPAGRPAYAAHDQKVEQKLTELSVGKVTDPQAFEDLARRYPVARLAPRAWLKASELHEAAGDARAAARAAEMGLQQAQRTGDAPMTDVGELGGRLVMNLRTRGLLSAAADALTRHRARFTDRAPLTVQGRPVDVASLERELSSLLSAERRPPRLGSPSLTRSQGLTGWKLMDALRSESVISPPTFFAMQRDDGSVGLFGSTNTADGPLVKELWVSPLRVDRAQLFRQTRSSAVFFWPGDGRSETGPVLFRVDAKDQAAGLTWTSKVFSSFFPQGTAPRLGGQPFRTPLDGFRSLSEMLLTGDDRSIAMIERGGRCAVLDAETGERLWSGSLGLTRLTDAALLSGLLVVAGDPVPAANQPAADNRPALLIIDARTGQVLRQVACPDGPVRWIRLTQRGDLIVGLESQIVSINTETGATEWSTANQPCGKSVDAWIVNDQLVVLDERRDLWLVSLSSGRAGQSPLEVRGRVEPTSRVQVSGTDNAIAVRSSNGLLLYDRTGKLIGVDGLNPADGLCPPLPILGGFVSVSYTSTPLRENTGSAFNVMILDNTSAMLRSSTPARIGLFPGSVAAIDNLLAITSDHSTIIFEAPPNADAPAPNNPAPNR
ncbi:MAG: PQQ-binding-like beta-propeller repeat protein [Phycisphaerales bacterium]|nr:PQQ-binding-like beta-propeller repeat protein [Phycisphaerales bacterium]